VVGAIRDELLCLDEVHRFPNRVVERDGHLRWDIRSLFGEVLVGLAQAPAVTSIGIDTWGVDYGLLDGAGELLADPISYREERTDEAVESVHDLIPPEDLFAETGVQFLPFNTIYQLVAERQGPQWQRTAQIVMIPDLIAFWLTGRIRCETTNASTTGLLDVRSRCWSKRLLDVLGIQGELLPPLEQVGEQRGITEDGIPVITVGSHDTASGVVGVPATTDRFAYIASGTWSLVGLELEQPILGEAARLANFTNEAGVDGRTRFLRNVGGLWLLQECLREWGEPDLGPLLAAAGSLPSGGPQVDVDDLAFIPPGNMPARIVSACGTPGLQPHAVVRCILDSLATAYARTIEQARSLSRRSVDVVHMVGGGSQNELLCQLTANATGVRLLAGPVEATAMGNIAVQARTNGDLPSSLEAIRERIAASCRLRSFEPE
jgi:rhamnulokinase